MTTTTSIAGPSLPPQLRVTRGIGIGIGTRIGTRIGSDKEELQQEKIARKIQSDSDSEDDFMPQLPPGFKTITPKHSTLTPIGPSLPPGFRKSEQELDEVEDEEEDLDVVGPNPLPDHLIGTFNQHNEGVIALVERQERQKEMQRIQEREGKSIKREEWMLLPPKELDLQASIDPTKIKSRGFKQTSKPHSSGTTDTRNQSSSLWTETPTERTQRLADEAIGKRRRAEETTGLQGTLDLETSKRKKRDLIVRQQVDKHNKSLRNASLLDLHQAATKNISKSKTDAEKETDKKRAIVWDREAMMGINSKILTETQKSDLIKDAKGLGGRFGGGSFL